MPRVAYLKIPCAAPGCLRELSHPVHECDENGTTPGHVYVTDKPALTRARRFCDERAARIFAERRNARNRDDL